jgi:hypothetical protein
VDGKVVMDPSGDEELSSSYQSSCLIAYMPSSQQITHISHHGVVGEDTLQQVTHYLECIPINARSTVTVDYDSLPSYYGVI